MPELWYPGFIGVAMFTAALNSKTLGVCICFVLGLACFYPAEEPATMLAGLFLPAVLLSMFRD